MEISAQTAACMSLATLVASLEGYTPFEFQQKTIRDPLPNFLS